ncbi:RNase P/RNase MRP complex subunit [Coemansia javaensis]|uniref:RNase P/RNase MRP complex subunit n=1 Tax=Coemansia javaensis TaxID=2761396 RepID=A0A9W8HJV7_9FUNG|nr:RNase P/RNase MRP complex subunit [Coemansia javaensis]
MGDQQKQQKQQQQQHTVDIYAPLTKAVRARSGAPMDVPVDAVTRKFAPGLVERSIDSAVSDIRAQTAYQERVEGRMLLLTNPFKERGAAGGGAAGRRRITAKERRQLRIHEIPEAARRHELFLPLHELWTKYIEALLGPDTEAQLRDPKQRQQLLGRLVKADLHGARVSVVRARCPNFVGISGILAQETKNTFKIITRDDRLAVVPKAHCVFALDLPPASQCLIYGDQFTYRASERATKKFKSRPTVDL